MPQSPLLLVHRSVTPIQHIVIWLISGEELTYFSFLNTLLRLPDPLRDVYIHHMNLNLSLHAFGRTFPTVFQ